jgi:hypothetical protein
MYDLFFFEVQTWPERPSATQLAGQVSRRARSGVKMLHEMRPNEMDSIIVSTPVLSRYKIGDLIRTYRLPYFRCIGATSGGPLCAIYGTSSERSTWASYEQKNSLGR